jgi:UDP-N-acetyl-2-amino-2-deoxyglucuronate dehydrogenase
MTYTIAIAGCGAIAGVHARAIKDLPSARLVAACARSPGKAERFCSEHGGKPYQTVEAMLDGERPDLLSVTTPSGAHLEPVLAAAARGVHVLCEKPLEITVARVDRMIRACDQARVVLGAVFQQRLSPVNLALREAAAGQRFGASPLISCAVPWWRDDAYYAPGGWHGTSALDGGGALMNQAIHGVDLVQWLAQAGSGAAQAVVEVSAWTATNGHQQGTMEVEDTAVVNLRLAGGGLGQILASTAMFPGSLRRMQIAGRDGSAEVMEDQLTQWAFRAERAADPELRARFGPPTAHGGGASDPMAITHRNHTLNIAALLESLASRTALALDGRAARHAVAIIEAAYASAASGRPVVPSAPI